MCVCVCVCVCGGGRRCCFSVPAKKGFLFYVRRVYVVVCIDMRNFIFAQPLSLHAAEWLD